MAQTENPTRKRTALRRALLRWFDRSRRDLPWRRTRNPYCIWVSEILLQQTRVEAVVPYYERFVEAFPTVQDLADASEDRVLKAWEGLGYYTRARNLRKAAGMVVEEMGGRFPTTAEGWRALPGVGPYTAGAIASIAFGERAAVVDGNVKRVLARLYCIDDEIEKAATTARFWELAEELVPRKRPGDFNQAMMELGARICVPKRPRCEACPARRWCEAFAQGRQRELPIRRKKAAIPHRDIAVAAIEKNGKYLLGKRPSRGLLGGLWEFPGGKIERGESPEEAVRRECREDLGIEVEVGALIAKVGHAYSHFTVELRVYGCRLTAGRARALWHSELRWVRPCEFERYAFPAANRKFLPSLGK